MGPEAEEGGPSLENDSFPCTKVWGGQARVAQAVWERQDTTAHVFGEVEASEVHDNR